MDLTVKVVPGSTRNRIVGRYGEGIKVQVSAAPEKGKANEAVIGLLAEFFGVPPSQVILVSGHAHPRKRFQIATDDGKIAQKLRELA